MKLITSIILYAILGGFLASQGFGVDTWQFYLVVGLFVLLEIKTEILQEDNYVSIN